MPEDDKISTEGMVSADFAGENVGFSTRCKKCGREMEQKDRCQCRTYLCYMCCECHLDCDLCNCSHKKRM